jgi:ribosomal protein S18 acetylase RimI-like enzyme
MRIGELDGSTIERATAIWSEAGVTRPWNDPRADFVRALHGETSAVLGAFANGDLVGTLIVGYDGHRGWVHYVAVSSGHRGKGIGRALMGAGGSSLRDRGAPKVPLTVRYTNEQAVGFYARIGDEDAQTTVPGRRLGESS